MISIVIPTLNEEKHIVQVLQRLNQESTSHETLVVDGGSSDRTVDFARPLAKVIPSQSGRGLQLNEGVKFAHGEVLLFLHGDCLIEPGTLHEIEDTIRKGFIGGCLTQTILDSNPVFRLIAWSGNVRARARKIFYGDQSIFVRKDVFLKLGAFRPLHLFEDVDFSRRLRREGRTIVLSKRVYTSSRRWNRQGILKTTLINRILLVLFYLRFPTSLLSKWYRNVR